MQSSLFGTLAIGGLLALPALAQPPEVRGDRPGREEIRERMLKEFDKDGDGKLSDEEREKLRETMRARFGRRGPDGRPGAPQRKLEAGKRDGEKSEKAKGDKRERGGGRGKDGRRGPGGAGERGRRMGGPPHQLSAIIFQRFDADGDDMLSRGEFEKLAQFVEQQRQRGPGGPPGGSRFEGRRPGGRRRGGDAFGPMRRGFDGPPPGAGPRGRDRTQRRPDGEGRPRPPRPDRQPGWPPKPNSDRAAAV